ncbi:MAG: L,D-transpeptidase [Bacteroidetes bacterium]|nr:L,D-transpeptidase [Bacteroidota bacterium]
MRVSGVLFRMGIILLFLLECQRVDNANLRVRCRSKPEKTITQPMVPEKERIFILVEKSSFHLSVYRYGKLNRTYEAAFGQSRGCKEAVKDKKTPEGDYRICEKKKGPFSGNTFGGYPEFAGTRWMLISYPNCQDALKGLRRKLISQRQ